MFDYTQNARRPQTVPCDKDLFETVTRSLTVSSICAEIRDALEKVKRGEMSREDFETFKRQKKILLPAFLFQAHFEDGKRHNESAVPSGLSIFDLDHIASPTVYFNEHVKERVKELGIVLAHVTPSTEGLRLVFVLYDGETPQEGQNRLASLLGTESYDEACKDLARCSFAVPQDYILYVDNDGLFTDRQPLAGEGLVPSRAPEGNSPDDTGNAPAIPVGHEALLCTETELRIFDETVSAAGLNEDNLNNVGTRHNSLITILSMGICRLMSEGQLRAVIAERMPEYSKEKDCQDLIRDFYAKYTDNNRPMSSKLRKIYTDSLRSAGEGLVPSRTPNGNGNTPKGIGKTSAVTVGHKALFCNAEDETDLDAEADDKKEAEAAALIKKILKKLPRGLKESIVGVPEQMKMPVLCAVLPIAAAYADGVTVRYCDGATQRLGLMSIIVGPQASGKSACKKKVELWERQMKDEDARAREIEDQWKEAKKSKKANEKSPEDPMVMIRSVPATISCSTLLRRFKNSRGHCLWTFCEELDTLRKTNGAGSWSSKYDIYRLGFDYGEWGQDYNSDQAVSGVVNVAYNFSILGTYGALKKCFRGDNVENGLSSRMIIAEMPDSAFAPMPRYSKASAGTASAIDNAVSLLRSQAGFVDTPRLRKAIDEWVEKKRFEAMADGDIVKDTYRKRAAVIGFRCGVVARLLSGKESNAVTEFATMMAQYVLDEQCKIFGPSLSNEYKQAVDEQERFSVNGSVFDNLPPVFTLEDIRQIKGPSVSRQSLYTIISRWKKSAWITKTGVNQWKKLPGKLSA